MVIYSAKDYLTVCQMTHKSVVWRNSVISTMMKEMKESSRRTRRKLARRLYNRRKPKNRHRYRGFAIGEMDHISDRQFREMFRIDRDTFKWLEELIHPLILRDETMAKRSSGSAITTRTRLAVTLRWLAGGSHLDLCFAWGISKSSFFSGI